MFLKNFKTLGGSSSSFALAKYTTISQTQAGAEVSLRDFRRSPLFQ
jgi:hypothetical protein